MVMGSAAAEAVRPARRCAGVIFIVVKMRREITDVRIDRAKGNGNAREKTERNTETD